MATRSTHPRPTHHRPTHSRPAHHRLFLVPTRRDVDLDVAVDHWERRHGEVFAVTPHLAGYVQHQPTRRDQRRLGGIVCAEAWFADADAERAAFRSAHYRGPVTTDESLFVDRTAAWAPLVVGEHHTGDAPDLQTSGIEVVAVGCDPAHVAQVVGPDVAVRVLTVDRAHPDGGAASVVIATVSSLDRATDLASRLTAPVVFVADRSPVLPPG